MNCSLLIREGTADGKVACMRYECFSVTGDYLGPIEADRSIEITEGKFISTEELRDKSYVHWEVIAVSQEDGGFRYVMLDPVG